MGSRGQDQTSDNDRRTADSATQTHLGRTREGMTMHADNGTIGYEGIDRTWLPNAYDRIDDRRDLKWWHPEMHSLQATSADPTRLGAVMRFFDPSNDKADRIEMRNADERINVEMYTQFGMIGNNACDREQYIIPGLCEGDPDITVLVSYPKGERKDKYPVLFGIGQSMMAENFPEFGELGFEPYCLSHGCAVVFAAARAGVDVEFPKPLDEYQAAYQWMVDNAEELHLDADNVVIKGSSGGGFTALCFAFRCKSVGLFPWGIMAEEPVMGDNMAYPSCRIITNCWDSANEQLAFRTVIHPGDFNSPFVSPEVSPSRATVEDCKGLAPIFLYLGELDGSRDAAIDLAQKCLAAKGFVQLHLWGGVPHAGVYQPVGHIHNVYTTTIAEELQDLFDHDLRRPWLLEM